jgi:hypothetical protein
VVYVPYRPDVDVRLGPLKLALGHDFLPLTLEVDEQDFGYSKLRPTLRRLAGGA